LVCLVAAIALALPGGFPAQGNDLAMLIADGPWTSLPPGAGPGLSLDNEQGALTLKPDLTGFVFVLSPDPSKECSANVVTDMVTHNGRLYLSYGSILKNLGPLDIVAYDPLKGEPVREMLAAPEEGFGRWYASGSGPLYVAGLDARESWSFGSFYVNDGFGWQKRRTIYGGVHVQEVVEFKDRLFCRLQQPAEPVLDYPSILVSDDHGASWSYQQIDKGPAEISYMMSLQTVTHHIGGRFAHDLECLYAIANYGSPAVRMQRLYRFDGSNWTRVTIPTAAGELRPGDVIAAFKGQVLVWGAVGSTDHVYALDGTTQREVPFLQGRVYLGPSFLYPVVHAECDNWFYCVVRDPPCSSGSVCPRSYTLCRTQDLLKWETMGQVELSPGAKPCSLGFAHGRPYVGASSMLMQEQWYGESLQRYVHTIQNSTLQWDADVPDGSQMSLKIRTAFMSTLNPPPLKGPWVGPDGTEQTAFMTSGQVLHSQHNGDNVFQAALSRTPNGNGQYPYVRSVTLNSPDGSDTLAVDEGSGLYTAVNSADPNGAEYVSKVFALQAPMMDASLFFEGATPNGTSLHFQVRSGAMQDQLAERPFVGPDGSPSGFYHSTGQPLWAGHNGDTYVQYRAMLASSNPALAPFLRKVMLVTQANRLDHLEIQLDSAGPWTAGQLHSISVTTKAADGTTIPVQAQVSLSAVAVDEGEGVRVQPDEMTLVNGVGTVKLSLQRATTTRICAILAGLRGYSPDIEVQPGEAAAIAVTSDLVEPLAHWSPICHSGQQFTLSLSVLDCYHNAVAGYTGTVHGERWSWQAEAEVMAPYTFQPSDRGSHEFKCTLAVENPGEWNLVFRDEAKPQVAGTLTVDVQ
jgi:hypothetical protein